MVHMISLKNKMTGFSNQIKTNKNVLLENINFIKNNLPEFNDLELLDTEIISITKDIVIQNDFIVKPHQKLVISPGVNVKIRQCIY